MKPGTEVKIVKGDHKGKRGKIGFQSARLSIQKGKVPVVFGSKNQVVWTRPDWVVSEDFPVSAELKPETSQVSPSRSQGDLEERILEHLNGFSLPRSEAQIAIALDAPVLEIGMVVRLLEANGKIHNNGEDFYCLPKFEAGQYVTDGSRTGLIASEANSIFTITFADGTEFQCTLEDLRENFTVCGNRLELSDSLKVSAGSAEQPNSSADLNGSSQSSLTMTQLQSSVTTSATELSSKTSDNTTQSQEQPTSTQSDFPAIIPATQAIAPDSPALNQDSGSTRSDVLLRDYLNSSLSSSQKESFIADCEAYLADSEWQGILGTIRSSYKQRKSELAKAEPGSLSCPTLTACDGKFSRPAGETRCEKWFKNKGLIPNSQYLSAEMMAVISGYPTTWTACLSQSSQEPPEELEADIFTGEQLSPSKQPSHSNESSTSTPSFPGKQWLNPARIILKGGTQSRDVNEVYEANPDTVQRYAELMKEGLWDWERLPLPVAFLSEDGKIYAGDCHHRASAALSAGKEIYIDLRQGELIDAILYSCRANTDHGLPLRAKDQRKRIELFLDTLEKLDEARSHQLLDSIKSLSEIERRNGKWSARIVAKYLKLTESGYRTVINIVQEREMALAFSQSRFNEGDWVLVKENAVDGSKFPWGTIAKIDGFDKRRGAFIVPLPGAVDNDGRIVPSGYIHPGCLEKTEAPTLIEAGKNTQPEPTSIEQELQQQAKALGLSNRVQVLPDVERNEGEPSSLVDGRPFATPDLVDSETVVDEIINLLEQLSEDDRDKFWSTKVAVATPTPHPTPQLCVDDFCSRIEQFSQEEINQAWEAIAPRVPLVEKFSKQVINLESFDDEDLQDLIAYANQLLEVRREELPNAS